MVLATCVLSWACLGGAARSECIDYGDYLHWVGGVDTPGYAWGVAISASHAYVAGDNAGLQVIDITDQRSPQRSRVMERATSAVRHQAQGPATQ